LEGTSKGHLVQILCNQQEHLQLDQTAQSPVLLDLECLHFYGELKVYLYSAHLQRALHALTPAEASAPSWEVLLLCSSLISTPRLLLSPT